MSWLKLSDRYVNLDKVLCVRVGGQPGAEYLALLGAYGLEFATLTDNGDIGQLLAVLNQNALLPHSPSPALLPAPASHVPADDGYVCGWCMGTRKVWSHGAAGVCLADCPHCAAQPDNPAAAAEAQMLREHREHAALMARTGALAAGLRKVLNSLEWCHGRLLLADESDATGAARAAIDAGRAALAGAQPDPCHPPDYLTTDAEEGEAD